MSKVSPRKKITRQNALGNLLKQDNEHKKILTPIPSQVLSNITIAPTILNITNPLTINISPEYNPLINYYSKEESSRFISKINKLNFNFQMLSDKYLTKQKDLDKIKEELFLNLFKQIGIYIEEVEHLNIKLKEKEEQLKNSKEANIIKELKEQINHNKQIITFYENKLSDKNDQEAKLRRETILYKRQVNFYRDKLKLELTGNNLISCYRQGNISSIQNHGSFSHKMNYLRGKSTKIIKSYTHRNYSHSTRKNDKDIQDILLDENKKILSGSCVGLSAFNEDVVNTTINYLKTEIDKEKDNKKIFIELGEEVQNECDKEIQMLNEQEKKIVKLMKLLN